jgi:hypothetical protein
MDALKSLEVPDWNWLRLIDTELVTALILYHRTAAPPNSIVWTCHTKPPFWVPAFTNRESPLLSQLALPLAGCSAGLGTAVTGTLAAALSVAPKARLESRQVLSPAEPC